MISGFSFVPGAAATMTSPTSMPLHLLALQKAAESTPGSSDGALRSAIVNVASYYLRLAQTHTPAQMEVLIWGKDSLDGADHGPTCAAFASLTLELAAQAVGKQSWVSGGTTYPWPLHEWADVRVDPNPDSLSVTSVVQDAEAHDRWHPLGDGYEPQPGDWVLFSGHVEVVTSYANGVLESIGADSLPNYTVNAHSFPGPLADQGVAGFVDNGHLGDSPPAPAPAVPPTTARPKGSASPTKAQVPGAGSRSRSGTAGAAASPAGKANASASQGGADIPGTSAMTGTSANPSVPAAAGKATKGSATIPASAPAAANTAQGAAAIPGAVAMPGLASTAPTVGSGAPGPASTSGPSGNATSGPYRKYTAPDQAGAPGTRAQQAFISQIAPGAIAAQQRYGVPAAVTIAQAIDESGWGQSKLALKDHNLFGIKGTGPAGSAALPTQEFVGGHWETITASFRVYHNIAESIADHAELLATDSVYQRAMADRGVPDAFANDLTGVYATDPEYGTNLIAVMRLYNLYRFDASVAHSHAPTGSHGSAASQATGAQGSGSAATTPAHPTPGSAAIPGVAATQGYAAAGTNTPASASPSAGADTPAGANNSAGARTSARPGTPPRAGTSARAGTPARAGAPAAGRAGGYAPGAGSAAIPGTVGFSGGTGARGPGAAQTPRAVRTPRAAPSRQPANRASATQASRQGNERETPVRGARATANVAARGSARIPGLATPALARYRPQIPRTVATAYFATAKAPLARAEPLYRDVASQTGIRWELLAACDWMQCEADPRYSPVHGEKIGALNFDGTVYLTKSEALEQCATDLVELTATVYGVDLTAPRILSVRALADAFAAFRWGALLRRHRVSSMEFPYSVAGLTAQHMKMHWPAINDLDAPDRPGARFRMPFGAVPVVLSLHYPATV